MIRDAKGRWINSEVFREDAINFTEKGYYCNYEEESKEWIEYWEERLDRTINGYSVDGVKITGNHYFYLNFSKISAVSLTGSDKTLRFPDFWDGDYNYFWCLEIAKNGLYSDNTQVPTTKQEKREWHKLNDKLSELDHKSLEYSKIKYDRDQISESILDKLGLIVKPHLDYLDGGYHFIAAKSRRKGYSYKNASICVNMYNNSRNTQIIVGASKSRYLYPSGTMTMVRNYMEFLNSDTGWVKNRDAVDRLTHIRASYKQKQKGGTFVERGFKSEVFAITFNADPDAARGKDAKLVLLEEAGDFPNLDASYSAIFPALTAGKFVTGQIVIYGTGGSMESANAPFINMFYNPTAYRIMPFYNIWDENAEDNLCGFFHPVTWNMEGFYDEQGNSNIEDATQHELNVRKKILEESSNRQVLSTRMQEFPLTPSEAFVVSNLSPFPVEDLQRQLNKVLSEDLQRKKGICTDLYYQGGKIIAKPDLQGRLKPVVNYVPKIEDLTGCPIIYEYPCENPPKGLYKIGYDPYRHDTSSGKSLAAVYVFKGVLKGSYVNNTIVAEYVGRPREADTVNRIVQMLCELYNAECLHENEVTHVKNYFRRVKKINLLAVQPDAVISSNIKSSRVSRVYGIHMTERLKDAMEKYIADWLLEVRDYDQDGNSIMNLETIYSIGLLEELIKYNRKGNFDRVIALGMCMFAVQEEEIGKQYDNNEEDKAMKNIINVFRKVYST